MPRRPRVVDNGDGSQSVELGTLLTGLLLAAILAGGGAVLTVGVLAYRAEAEERKVEKVVQDVERQGRNQLRLDETQRRIQQDTEWANAKLDALLEELQVSRRVPEPPLPPSVLEVPTPPASSARPGR